MKLDFNFDGKTLLKKWWQQVKSNFQTVQDEYNTCLLYTSPSPRDS